MNIVPAEEKVFAKINKIFDVFDKVSLPRSSQIAPALPKKSKEIK